MKKFQFSLSKLKDFRNQLLEKEKNELARLRREQQALIEQIEQLKIKLDVAKADFSRKASRGLNATQILYEKDYQKSLSEQINQLVKCSEEMDEKILRQLNVVIEATKDVSALDKLEEKQLEEYKFREAKAEEQFIAEYVLNSTYRS